MSKKVFPIRVPEGDEPFKTPQAPVGDEPKSYPPPRGFADGGQGEPLFIVNVGADRGRATELGTILRSAVDKVLDIAIAQDGLEPDLAYLLQHAIRASNAAMDFAASD